LQPKIYSASYFPFPPEVQTLFFHNLKSFHYSCLVHDDPYSFCATQRLESQ